MAIYETAVVSSQVGLLNALITFLTTNGWTLNTSYAETFSYYRENINDSSPDGKCAHLQKVDSYGETFYMNFYACYRCYASQAINSDGQLYADPFGNMRYAGECNGLVGYPSLAYHAPTGWDDKQVGGPVYGASDLGSYVGMSGFMEGQNMTYWFFAQGDSIHIVVEWSPGYYQHMSFGTLVKAGYLTNPYTGGQYMSASSCALYPSHWPHWSPIATSNQVYHTPWSHHGNNNGMLRVDADGIGDRWRPLGLAIYGSVQLEGYVKIGYPYPAFGNATPGAYHTTTGLNDFLFTSSPSSVSRLTPMMPIHFRTHRINTGNHFSNAGYPEGIRHINAKDLNPGEVLELGPDHWQVFPTMFSSDESNHYQFGVPAVAILKD